MRHEPDETVIIRMAISDHGPELLNDLGAVTAVIGQAVA